MMEALRSWWEVPSIAHYCSLFRSAFDLADFDIEDLEEALLESEKEEGSEFIFDLVCRLLNGCYGRKDITQANFDLYVKDVIKYKWGDEEKPIKEKSEFKCLNLREKVELILCLCEYRLDTEDVADLLKGFEGDNMRVEPLGKDKDGGTYWYFYGSRLYKEDPKKELSKAEKKAVAQKKKRQEKNKKKDEKNRQRREKEKLKEQKKLEKKKKLEDSFKKKEETKKSNVRRSGRIKLKQLEEEIESESSESSSSSSSESEDTEDSSTEEEPEEEEEEEEIEDPKPARGGKKKTTAKQKSMETPAKKTPARRGRGARGQSTGRKTPKTPSTPQTPALEDTNVRRSGRMRRPKGTPAPRPQKPLYDSSETEDMDVDSGHESAESDDDNKSVRSEVSKVSSQAGAGRRARKPQSKMELKRSAVEADDHNEEHPEIKDDKDDNKDISGTNVAMEDDAVSESQKDASELTSCALSEEKCQSNEEQSAAPEAKEAVDNSETKMDTKADSEVSPESQQKDGSLNEGSVNAEQGETEMDKQAEAVENGPVGEAVEAKDNVEAMETDAADQTDKIVDTEKQESMEEEKQEKMISNKELTPEPGLTVTDSVVAQDNVLSEGMDIDTSVAVYSAEARPGAGTSEQISAEESKEGETISGVEEVNEPAVKDQSETVKSEDDKTEIGKPKAEPEGLETVDDGESSKDTEAKDSDKTDQDEVKKENVERVDESSIKTEPVESESVKQEGSHVPEVGKKEPVETDISDKIDDKPKMSESGKPIVPTEPVLASKSKLPPVAQFSGKPTPPALSTSCDTGWHLICQTLDDWVNLAEWFKDSSVRCEKSLAKVIREDFIPVLPEIIEAREAEKKKRLQDLEVRRSHRLTIKQLEKLEQEKILAEALAEEEKARIQDEDERKLREEQLRLEEENKQREERVRAREERAKRLSIREEKARLLAEGKEIPPELIYTGTQKYKDDSDSEDSRCDLKDEESYEALVKIIDAMKLHKDCWPFLEPVTDAVAPGYSEVIKRPMDMSKIEEKVQTREYRSTQHYLSDFRLMFNNCKRFNGQDSDFTECAKTMEKMLKKYVKRFLTDEPTDKYYNDKDFTVSVKDTGEKRFRPKRAASSRALQTVHKALNSDYEEESSEEDSNDDDEASSARRKDLFASKTPAHSSLLLQEMVEMKRQRERKLAASALENHKVITRGPERVRIQNPAGGVMIIPKDELPPTGVLRLAATREIRRKVHVKPLLDPTKKDPSLNVIDKSKSGSQVPKTIRIVTAQNANGTQATVKETAESVRVSADGFLIISGKNSGIRVTENTKIVIQPPPTSTASGTQPSQPAEASITKEIIFKRKQVPTPTKPVEKPPSQVAAVRTSASFNTLTIPQSAVQKYPASPAPVSAQPSAKNEQEKQQELERMIQLTKLQAKALNLKGSGPEAEQKQKDITQRILMLNQQKRKLIAQRQLAHQQQQQQQQNGEMPGGTPPKIARLVTDSVTATATKPASEPKSIEDRLREPSPDNPIGQVTRQVVGSVNISSDILDTYYSVLNESKPSPTSSQVVVTGSMGSTQKIVGNIVTVASAIPTVVTPSSNCQSAVGASMATSNVSVVNSGPDTNTAGYVSQEAVITNVMTTIPSGNVLVSQATSNLLSSIASSTISNVQVLQFSNGIANVSIPCVSQNNTVGVAGDSVVIQNNGTLVQDNAALAQSSATMIHNNATLVQDNATVVQDIATLVQDNATVVQDIATLVQENASVVQDNSSLVPSVIQESVVFETPSDIGTVPDVGLDQVLAPVSVNGTEPSSAIEALFVSSLPSTITLQQTAVTQPVATGNYTSPSKSNARQNLFDMFEPVNNMNIVANVLSCAATTEGAGDVSAARSAREDSPSKKVKVIGMSVPASSTVNYGSPLKTTAVMEALKIKLSPAKTGLSQVPECPVGECEGPNQNEHMNTSLTSLNVCEASNLLTHNVHDKSSPRQPIETSPMIPLTQPLIPHSMSPERCEHSSFSMETMSSESDDVDMSDHSNTVREEDLNTKYPLSKPVLEEVAEMRCFTYEVKASEVKTLVTRQRTSDKVQLADVSVFMSGIETGSSSDADAVPNLDINKKMNNVALSGLMKEMPPNACRLPSIDDIFKSIPVTNTVTDPMFDTAAVYDTQRTGTYRVPLPSIDTILKPIVDSNTHTEHTVRDRIPMPDMFGASASGPATTSICNTDSPVDPDIAHYLDSIPFSSPVSMFDIDNLPETELFPDTPTSTTSDTSQSSTSTTSDTSQSSDEEIQDDNDDSLAEDHSALVEFPDIISLKENQGYVLSKDNIMKKDSLSVIAPANIGLSDIDPAIMGKSVSQPVAFGRSDSQPATFSKSDSQLVTLGRSDIQPEPLGISYSQPAQFCRSASQSSNIDSEMLILDQMRGYNKIQNLKTITHNRSVFRRSCKLTRKIRVKSSSPSSSECMSASLTDQMPIYQEKLETVTRPVIQQMSVVPCADNEIQPHIMYFNKQQQLPFVVTRPRTRRKYCGVRRQVASFTVRSTRTVSEPHGNMFQNTQDARSAIDVASDNIETFYRYSLPRESDNRALVKEESVGSLEVSHNSKDIYGSSSGRLPAIRQASPGSYVDTETNLTIQGETTGEASNVDTVNTENLDSHDSMDSESNIGVLDCLSPRGLVQGTDDVSMQQYLDEPAASCHNTK